MAAKKTRIPPRSDTAIELAGRLYDYKLAELAKLNAEQKAGLLAQFPNFRQSEFDALLEQVIAAKRYEQERVGWRAVPHDVTVLVVVALTSLFDLRIGVIAGIGVLVLLESLFQYIFDRRLYRSLSALVWLTYPAYAWLAYLLYRRGYELLWIAVIVALVWWGTFLLGMLARLPVRLIMEAKLKAAEEAVKKKLG
jgi:hypothetical protein